MSTIALYAALTLALANALLGQSSERLQRVVNGVAWLGVVGGFLAMQFGEGGLAVATATASMAGIATLRCLTEDPDRRRRILTFGSIVPAMIAVVGIVCLRDATSAWSGQLLLYAAAWSAMSAGASSLLASAGVARAPLGPGVALASLGALGGIAVVGTGRSSLSNAEYGFPLRAGEEPLQWILGPVPGFEDGIRLAVAAPVPSILWAVGAIGAAVLVAGTLAYLGKARRVQLFAWAAAALGSLGVLGSLQTIAAGLSMPDSAPYADQVKRMLLARDVADRVQGTGEFTVGEQADLSVALADLAPEIFGFGIVILVAAVALFVSVRHRSDEPADNVDLAFSRDHAARGLAFLWVSWCVLLLVHNLFLGAPGMGAPGEWVYVGLLLAGTGLTLYGWRMESPVERHVTALASGLVLGGLLLVVAVAWRFGALPGLSIGVL
jgi:hypothetical protein